MTEEITLLAHFASALMDGNHSGLAEDDEVDWEDINYYLDDMLGDDAQLVEIGEPYEGVCEATGRQGSVADYTYLCV